jgi:hypothetical protein
MHVVPCGYCSNRWALKGQGKVYSQMICPRDPNPCYPNYILIQNVVLWPMIVRSLVGGYQRFGGTCCLRLHGARRQQVPHTVIDRCVK